MARLRWAHIPGIGAARRQSRLEAGEAAAAVPRMEAISPGMAYGTSGRWRR